MIITPLALLTLFTFLYVGNKKYLTFTCSHCNKSISRLLNEEYLVAEWHNNSVCNDCALDIKKSVSCFTVVRK